MADLQELLAGSEIVVFELLDALAEGRQGAALAAYRRLLRQGGRAEELTPQIIALYRRLLICRLALEERASLAEVQAAHGVKLIDKLRGQARGWSSEALRQALGLLLALDRRLKRGETEAEAGLEVAIDQLAALHQAGAASTA
jgi:DNA polymerase III delta subunit